MILITLATYANCKRYFFLLESAAETAYNRKYKSVKIPNLEESHES